MLAEMIDRFPKSMIAREFFGQAATGLLTQAEQLRISGDVVQSMTQLDLVLEKFSGTEAGELAEAERQRIAKELLDGAEQLRATDGEAGYAEDLRKIAAKFAGTHMESVANHQLEALAIELLCKARDASFQRDWKTRDEANQQLDDAFAGDANFARLYEEFAENEQRARELFRRAQRNEKATNIKTACGQYADIIKQFATTLAAKKAQDRLRILKPQIVGHDQELAELMLMMQQ